MDKQDEAKCEAILEEQVAKVKESLPAESSQPGYELVYITRSKRFYAVKQLAAVRYAELAAHAMQHNAAPGRKLLMLCIGRCCHHLSTHIHSIRAHMRTEAIV